MYHSTSTLCFRVLRTIQSLGIRITSTFLEKNAFRINNWKTFAICPLYCCHEHKVDNSQQRVLNDLQSTRLCRCRTTLLHPPPLLFPLFSHQQVVSREYWMFYWGPDFLASGWLGSSPPPFISPLPTASCISFSIFLYVCGRTYRREREWGRIHITRRRESMVLNPTFNTLWCTLNCCRTSKYAV